MIRHKRPFTRALLVPAALLFTLFGACSAPAAGSSGISPSPSVSPQSVTSPSPSAAVSASPTASPASASPGDESLQSLSGLLGMTKDKLLQAVPETPEKVDEGGLGFPKTGIRVWFDSQTYTKVAQVLVMTDSIDLNGVRLGSTIDQFKAVFGNPVSDSNNDMHFKYDGFFLSVPYDAASGKSVGVYILAEDF